MSVATQLSVRGLLFRRSRTAPATLACGRIRTVAVSASASNGAGGGVVLRSLASNGECAVLVADCTPLVAYAQRIHSTLPTATAALGRGLVGGLLLGSFQKDGQTVQLSFKGGGPLGQMIIVADSTGSVKGMVSNRFAEPPLRPDGKLNVGAAVGNDGILSVVRNHPDFKEPYTGVVPITSGEVAEDIATYLTQSEQVASAIGLGVLVGKDLQVEAAGGFLVQVLPFAGDDTLAALERNIGGLPSVTTMLSSGMTPAQITERILDGIGMSPGSQEMTPRYGPCVEEDIRARMERACVSLGASELTRIIEKEEKLEVTCELCRITLQLDAKKVLREALPSQ